jgi:hypothetical protein
MSGNNGPIIKGGGVAGVFEAFLSILQTFATSLLLGAGVLWFLYLLLRYMWNIKNGKSVDDIKKQIPWAIVLLTVMFSVYALVNLFANMLSLQIGQ